ncbi:uncharacterized protein LOC132745477 isoform X2 [Ruditapes philippinarum]|uniref:uncharacterized protein LOC132745477 isoform X2 n=1 Tax=Ruditapes philippinarum TaxID=129788 RepID=UPI00295B012F|nr:uncharacterized protein LOC132745477 isoform X2 [Ruditapes philippinarum]
MPATNYNWPFNEEQPIFNVYGTKRKNCDDSRQDVVEEMETKRRCTESRPGMEEDGMTDSMDISGQPESQMHHSHQPQVTMNNRVPPLPDQTGDHIGDNNNTILHTGQGEELNNNMTSQSDLDIQNNMLMDLNEGVYSTATLPINPQTDAEYEAACSMMAAMEGEGAPNPQQYSLSYCDSHCVGGSWSPNSGKVRCSCRPSWEGLTDVRPYISDYY